MSPTAGLPADEPGAEPGSESSGRRLPGQRLPRLLAMRGTGALVGWSLAAANGRRLACSVTLYRSEPELAAALGELRADRHALRCSVLQEQGRSWSWRAHLPARRSAGPGGAGEPIARSARSYLRQDQCRKGLDGFLAALDLLPAEAWDGVLPGGRHR
ncbi:hypothetical protein [Kitasatospora sp. MAP5-34]|uniref:hypothetical protein n=1 Tax=Kitasatospora sp. MAP5-34 TaxID=3035102 RepID=UPI002473105F|nr:hypothetical protein [Kitasatospora sp. MAP5-34]MDH6579937.1 hypothetical protein [Kitasatospora sp. MAP5-34]